MLAAQQRITTPEYIRRYESLALEQQAKYGIPASIKMAQAILESDCGNSRLARQANNHFGIKCKRDWTGGTIRHDDDERNECFRSYASAEESFRDHSVFLERSPRYQKLFTLDPLDYKGWAYGLKEAGYATNPRYPQLLIRIIEDNKLYLLDEGRRLPDPTDGTFLAGMDTPGAGKLPEGLIDVDRYVIQVSVVGGYVVGTNNGSEYVLAQAGDTPKTLAGKLGVPVRRLRRYNDLEKDAQLSAGERVYITPKQRKAADAVIHTVSAGETLRTVSQTYAVKLARLVAMNRLDAAEPLNNGEQVRLK